VSNPLNRAGETKFRVFQFCYHDPKRLVTHGFRRRMVRSPNRAGRSIRFDSIRFDSIQFNALLPSQFRLGPIPKSVPVVAVSQGILRQVFLVFLVGSVKRRIIDNVRFHFLFLVRRDGLRFDVPLELRLDFLGDFLLVVRRTKHHASVLAPPVVPLLVQGRRIVKTVKESHHVLENGGGGRRGFRQFDGQDLDVARRSAADLAVGRVLHALRVGIHKTDLGVGDASGVFLLKVLDDVFFGSPVAAIDRSIDRLLWYWYAGMNE